MRRISMWGRSPKPRWTLGKQIRKPLTAEIAERRRSQSNPEEHLPRMISLRPLPLRDLCGFYCFCTSGAKILEQALDPSPINRNRLPGDVTRLLRREECRQGREFLRLTEPSHRNLRLEPR